MATAAQIKNNSTISELTNKEFQSLLLPGKTPAFSIFMPTPPSVRGSNENVVRLKALLRRAEAEWVATSPHTPNVHALLQPIEHLVTAETLSSDSKSLALFATMDFFRAYGLPFELPELVNVGGRFFVKPILPMFAGDDRFYILALSQKHVRLLHGTLYGSKEVQLHGVPANLFEVFESESFARQKQFHTASRADAGDRPISHGSGTEIKDRIVAFFRRVEKGVTPAIQDSKAPLILAGVHYLLPLYREVNTSPALVDDAITGNPDSLSAQQLHAAGWEIVQRRLEHETKRAQDQYKELAGTPQTSSNLREIVAASHNGRVLSLFLAEGAEQWGFWDSEQGVAHVHHNRESGDEDLLNFAAIQTLLHHGNVHSVAPVELPDGANLAALFRF